MLKFRVPELFLRNRTVSRPVIEAVEMAIPVFIGYTEKGPPEPRKVTSMHNYGLQFGGPARELPAFSINASGDVTPESDIKKAPFYKMYYMLQMYFANGGGPCYIISAGNYAVPFSASLVDYLDGLQRLKQQKEPSQIVFPDAQSLTDSTQYHDLLKATLMHCSQNENRFLICDLLPADDSSLNPVEAAAGVFRNAMGVNNLMHGAAYYPGLETSLKYQYEEDKVEVTKSGAQMVLRHSDATLAENPDKKEESLFHANNGAGLLEYRKIRAMIDAVNLQLPPSAALAGVYATVDNLRGVWKAPANVSLNMVLRPTESLDNNDQRLLNVFSSGKSINAIREFPGKGVLVWGARTLAGNDNEWRYVSVRRLCNMVQTSIKKATETFVFEPNDANTWRKIETMINNFLMQLWRQGALAGLKADDAFFVNAGLGKTMTQNDIQQGRMIIEIGIAVMRPAQFIVLRISHQMK